MTTNTKTAPKKKITKKVVKKTLASFQPKEHKLKILSPSDFEDTGGWMQIVGIYSDEFDDASRSMRDLLSEVPDTDLEDETIKSMAKCVKDWCPDFFGEPFSEEACYKILSNPKMAWIRVQLDLAIKDTTNFF